MILTLNAGSSSLRIALFDEKLKQLYKGHIDGIGQRSCKYRRYFNNGTEKKTRFKAKNHKDALKEALIRLQSDGAIKHLREIKKVGHRVVHGGEKFTETTKLNPFNIKKIEKLSNLAPLHNPANIAAIKASRRLLRASHYAIFDTAFHATLPEKAFLYGLPFKLYKKEGIRRYGFHGISHKYVAGEAAKILKKKSAKVITCHIGNGVSIAAVKNGKSLDTTMGFTPLEGPMMGTRSGTIDPAIIFHLTNTKRPLKEVHRILEKESGFKGVSGISSDIRKLLARLNSKGTQRTFEIFSYQMAKYILGYFGTLGKPDTIVFTAGIGENVHYLRKQICNYMKEFGVKLDSRKNRENAQTISTKSSSIKILVIPTNEELQMAREIRN